MLTQDYSKHLANTVADHISAMLAYWDKNLICRFANVSYLEWFGQKHEDMVDKMTLPELLGPLFEKNLPYITEVLKGNVQTFEREIPHSSGKIRHSLASYYPDIADDGEVKGFFVHVADVSPIKKLEKELMLTNETINQQNKRLLNFANIVSHNLKSYSGNLSSVLDLLTLAETESERNELINYLQSIAKGFGSTVNHLNEIVKAQNQVNIKSEQINLHDYVEQTIDTLRMQIASSHSTIINNIEKDVTLFVNPAYIESILLNFLTNAIKYGFEGRPPIIELSCCCQEDKIMLIIKDNGRGIDLKKHGDKLFGMYKTFHGNPDAQGIGLFITKYQIETMGGNVEVESEENIGTTFKIYFKSTE